MSGHGSRRLFLALLLAAQVAAVEVAPAQDGPAGPPGDRDTVAERPPGRVLSVTTDPPGARIFVDGTLAGVSPLAVRLPDSGAAGPGGGVVLVVEASGPGSWSSATVGDTIRTDRDTLARHYALPLPVRIDSDPQGAEVARGDSVLGTTPLFAVVPRSTRLLAVSKEGYRRQEVPVDPATSGYLVRLVPGDAAGSPSPSPLAGVAGRSNTLPYVAAAVAVAAGTVAAWSKNRADGFYEDYRSNGDRALLDRVDRLDLTSGIALGVAQVCLGYLVIELLSR